MPKEPEPSPLDSEANVAMHVQREREARGWSTAELARRVAEAGYPMNQSAIWRIESGEPRRRISVDEMLGFAKVFGMTVDQLLGPFGEGEEIQSLMTETSGMVEAFIALREEEINYEAWREIVTMRAWVDESLRDRVGDFIAESARQSGSRRVNVDRLTKDVLHSLAQADGRGIPVSADFSTAQRWMRARIGEARARALISKVHEVAMAHSEDEVATKNVISGTSWGKSFGRDIRHGRGKKGFSPVQLGKMIGLSAGHVLRMEKGNFDGVSDLQVCSAFSAVYDDEGQVEYYKTAYREIVADLQKGS